ncbi:hypothetical protein AURDEDRAFT_86510 [Auricularia subglabra TFB-10046 SS5]|nr:hypothetical protein AURDEDRAFT_86510 [Auricularia subglabra TFB-10046 SS5]
MPTSTNHERPPHLRHSKSSIDESLELEHALAAEEGDVPLSPGASVLDPQVLADLIIQLRAQLGELTRERDELVNELAASQTREAELTDALEQARDRSRAAESNLEAARKTHQEDEEAVSMLRAKVEESRRALMRLQSEASSARRASGQFQLGGPLALDLSKAPGSSKRASFTPLTGTFKRGSPPPSVPGSPPAHPSSLLRNTSSDGENDSAAETQSLMVLPSESNAPSTARGRRFPGSISTRDSIMNPLGAELDAMRRELVEARQEAITLRAELRDANESRLASEACVQALREFIANTAAGDAVSPGGLGLSLPPLPTDTGVNAVGDEKPKAGWGLKLWRKDTASAAAPGSSHSHASTPSISSTMSRRKSDASESHPPVARSGFWASKASSGTASAAVSPSVAQPPAGKKFGFLWGAPAKEPEPAALPVPGLSPPSSSSDHPSEPTSPKDDRPRSGTDLVVQYDETLTDTEDADKTFTQAHEKSPLEPPLTPRNEGPIGVAA